MEHFGGDIFQKKCSNWGGEDILKYRSIMFHRLSVPSQKIRGETLFAPQADFQHIGFCHKNGKFDIVQNAETPLLYILNKK